MDSPLYIQVRAFIYVTYDDNDNYALLALGRIIYYRSPEVRHPVGMQLLAPHWPFE